MSKPIIDCLLWDVDGTLTDTTALIAEALDVVYQKYYNKQISYEERRALIGTPLKKQIRIFGEPEEFGTNEAAVMADFIHHYETQKHREKILEPVIAILIEGKQRGFPTALITSKNREELANTLPRLGIAEVIDIAVTADDVLRPKPAPEGLLKALAHVGCVSERAVYIGDTLHDMRAAKSAGVAGIGVTWGAATYEMMHAESPAYICESPEALRDLLF